MPSVTASIKNPTSHERKTVIRVLFLFTNHKYM